MHYSELTAGDTVQLDSGAFHGRETARVIAVTDTHAEVERADGTRDTVHGESVEHGIGWQFKAPAPREGLPATVGIGSDCYAYTVIAVSKSGKRITLRRAKVRTASGNDFQQNARRIYVDDENGETRDFSLRKDLRWRPVGSGANSGYYLALGRYHDYRDPSF